MENDIRERQHRMVTLLLVNLLIVLIAPNYYRVFTQLWGDYLLAFVVGAIALNVNDRRYGRFLLSIAQYVVYFVWQMILSGLSVAWLVLQPKPKLDPGIIAVPLDVDGDLEITILASSITLTPGSISLELDRSGERPILYVHYPVVGDPDRLRASIKSGFERILMRISRGTT